jgi:hypothetical protein
MTRIKLSIIALLMTSTVAHAVGGMVYAPPSPDDQSCMARAIRLYPWASQTEQRTDWQAQCESGWQYQPPPAPTPQLPSYQYDYYYYWYWYR